jgi:hypothetical protein
MMTSARPMTSLSWRTNYSIYRSLFYGNISNQLLYLSFIFSIPVLLVSDLMFRPHLLFRPRCVSMFCLSVPCLYLYMSYPDKHSVSSMFFVK